MNIPIRISLTSICPVHIHAVSKVTTWQWSILKSAFKALMILLLFLLLTIPSTAAGEIKSLFRIGTGGSTGVYYPIGKLIAEGLTKPVEEKNIIDTSVKGVPGIIGVAQNSAGSIENVRDVVSGQIEAGLVQADVAAWAFRAEHAFAGNPSGRALRAVASLYPELFQLVTRRDANIRSVPDIRGKRISIDELGSGTLSVVRIVLASYGLSENDFSPVYLKPVFTHDKIAKNELQGFAMMAGAPMKAVTQLSDTGLFLVPIDLKKASEISVRFPYLVPGKIPSGIYSGIPETPTLQVYALLVVSAESSEDLIYKVTTALWSERTLSLLQQGHPMGKIISPETALTGLSIPLHAGAERFYREKGLLLKGSRSP
ncbi:MAG: TAXI family TRAP transporter solute-binding subunit [Desulfobacteraceae bacterium]|nr:MAG: TAXI family TRAP transporter solute-binding subunit [Desulfobacteraceae bacterium]